MKITRESMLLYAITDRTWLANRTLAEVTEEVLSNGATFLQLREKDLNEANFLDEAVELKALCEKYNVPFVINDNVAVAKACGAHGVHVGQSDIVGRDIRAEIGPDMILGISANTVESAVAAQNAGADYIGVGAVFGTTTKKDAQNLSVPQLREICAAVSIPVVAIGGINAGNVCQLRGSGIDGICVISAIYAQPDVAKATATLRTLAESTLVPFDKKYCVFDMDGTLVDSMGFWRTLGYDYLVALGKSPTEEELEATRPMTMIQAGAYFKELYQLEGTPLEIVAAMEGVMDGHYRNSVPLKEGVVACLEELKKRGIRMCVATATAEPLVEACFQRLGIAQYFEFVLSCETLGISKSKPDIYQEAARRFGAPVAEVAVFEDAHYAAQTAQKAGFYVVGIADEVQRSHWDRMQAMCDRTINCWEELLK